MYSINNTKTKNTNQPGNRNIGNDLINQDVSKMLLQPPHCPLHPKTYTSFFNDNPKLSGVAPYKLEEKKHSKDGKLIAKLQYNNFYTDWTQDATKWYPNTNELHPSDINININSDMHLKMSGEIRGKMSDNVPLNNVLSDKNLELYRETKRKEPFAIPLATNGTNQLNILFNNKCTRPTFNYRRYASEKVNNKEWFNNRLYAGDISEETEGLKNQYMAGTIQNSMDLYSSVFEDMYFLSNEKGFNDVDAYNQNNLFIDSISG